MSGQPIKHGAINTCFEMFTFFIAHNLLRKTSVQFTFCRPFFIIKNQAGYDRQERIVFRPKAFIEWEIAVTPTP